jgi:hypothetical protein
MLFVWLVLRNSSSTIFGTLPKQQINLSMEEETNGERGASEEKGGGGIRNDVKKERR